MKTLLMGLFLVVNYAHAGNFTVTVQNFNFSYQNPIGQGSATYFNREPVAKDTSGVEVIVNRNGEDFILSVSGAYNQDFQLKSAPSFMTEADHMNVERFDLVLNDQFVLGLEAGQFESTKNYLGLEGLTLQCARETSLQKEVDQLVQGCINYGRMKVGKFVSKDMDNLIGELTQALIAAATEGLVDKSSIGVNNLDLKINSGKYALSGEVKAQMSGKIKSSGNLAFSASDQVLTIKINEVKFSFLDITSKVFDELKKKESDKLKVAKPYVYFSLK